MKIVLASNTAWYLHKFRLSLALALKAAGCEVVAVAPRDGHAERIEAAGIRFEALPLDNKGLNPFRDLAYLVRVHALLRRVKPDVFLGYTVKPNVYGGLACRWLGIASIHNVSGLGTAFLREGIVTKIVGFLYRAGLGRARKVFFQNREDHDEFVRRRLVPEGLAEVLPGSGVDLERFAPGDRPAPDVGGGVRFLLLARLIWDKGVGEYVEAARWLRAQGVAATCQLAGFLEVKNRTAIPRPVVEGWVREGVVEYLGEADDVRSFISAADCVVLPSYREGTPRSLLEAASMAKPVIATNTPGCRDVVADGVSGFLCRVRDARDLADKMRRIAEMTGKEREAMGSAGREKMEREYDERIVIGKYLAEIARLEEGGGRR